MLKYNVVIFGLSNTSNAHKVYDFLIEKALPFYAQFRGVKLHLQYNHIVANEITESEETFLRGICNGYALGLNLIEE